MIPPKRQPDIVTLTIDGIQVEARQGTKVLEAALNAGIYIPNLCFLREAEPPFAGCRLCMVEIEGYPNTVISCTEPVQEGMMVRTSTPHIRRLQRTAAELIIAAHRVDCGSCSKNRHCELQKLAAFLGVKLKSRRLRKMPRELPVDASHPFILRDMTKCVLCNKCVWTCNDRLGVGAIDLIFRGFGSQIGTFGNRPLMESKCESWGECTAVCPVGALVPRNHQWPTQETKSICPYCSAGCGMYLGVREGRVVSVRGDAGSPTSKGILCAKGRFGFEFIHHPDRLVSPLIRRANGFARIGWEEALGEVGDKLSRYQGKETAVIASGKCSNEASYVLQKFARTALATHNIDQCSRLCATPSLPSPLQGLDHETVSRPLSEIGEAACVFVIGANPIVSHPLAGVEIRQALRRGARLIVAGPRRNELSRQARPWLPLRPGSDMTLLIGMMRVILTEGLEDRPFIEKHCEGFEAFQESLLRYNLDLIEQATGVPRNLVIAAARSYATQKPATILCGTGLTQQADGAGNVQALVDLALLTGNINQPSAGVNLVGGQNNAQGARDMGALPDFYPGHQAVADPPAQKRFEQAWGGPLSACPGLTLLEIFQAAYRGEIKALYVVGANPLLTMPQSQYIQQALERLELLVVQDIFLSETARLAHIVLPAASFAEGEGTFTNYEGRAQLAHQAIVPIGDSRPDWQIICQVAGRMGVSGFKFRQPAEIREEIARLVPSYAGISGERLETDGSPYPYPDRETPTTAEVGKYNFTPLHLALPAEPSDREYPLMLITERSLYQYNTSLSQKVEGLHILSGEGVVEINPADASALGVAEGEMVRIISQQGEVAARARLTADTPPGVVSMSFHFAGTPANRLTNQVIDPISKAAALKRCAVRIVKGT